MKYLDKEEEKLITWIGEEEAKGNFKSIMTPDLKNRLEKAATETLRKNKTMTVRVSDFLIEKLKRNAAREGLNYTSYAASILHKYA